MSTPIPWARRCFTSSGPCEIHLAARISCLTRPQPFRRGLDDPDRRSEQGWRDGLMTAGSSGRSVDGVRRDRAAGGDHTGPWRGAAIAGESRASSRATTVCQPVARVSEPARQARVHHRRRLGDRRLPGPGVRAPGGARRLCRHRPRVGRSRGGPQAQGSMRRGGRCAT